MNLPNAPRPFARWLLLPLILAVLGTAGPAAADSKLKTWMTAELLGAMRWAKAEATDRREKLDFSAAEIICYRRLRQQIDRGDISRGAAFLIAENVRKQGVYRRENLTLARAEELRRTIVVGRILEKISD